MNTHTTPHKSLSPRHFPSTSVPFTVTLCRSREEFYKYHGQVSRIRTAFNSYNLQKQPLDYRPRQSDTRNCIFGSPVSQSQKRQNSSVSEFIIQQLESSIISHADNYTIDASKLQIKAIKPFYNHETINQNKIDQQGQIILDEVTGQENNSKFNNIQNGYHYNNQLNNSRYFAKNNANNLSDIIPNTYISCSSNLPSKVIQVYNNYKSHYQKQINFIQGYLHKISTIYYAIQNTLILYFPSFTSKQHGQKKCLSVVMEIPNIVYNIVQTGINQKQFKNLLNHEYYHTQNTYQENGQIIIMCHPYSIELYYLSYEICWQNYDVTSQNSNKNPIQKLNMKYTLPNYAQPLNLSIIGHFIYYCPDKSILNLSALDMQTGKITESQCKNIGMIQKYSPKQTQHKQNKCQFPIRNAIQYLRRNTLGTIALNLSTYLVKKVTNSLLYPQSHTWINKLSQSQYTSTNIKQMISNICQHVNLIACVIEIKVQGVIGNFIHKINQQHKNNNICYRKLVRLYIQQNIQRNIGDKDGFCWNCQDIQSYTGEQILSIAVFEGKRNTLHETIGTNICNCNTAVIIKTYNQLQAKYYERYYYITSINKVKIQEKLIVEYVKKNNGKIIAYNAINQGLICIKQKDSNEMLIINKKDNNKLENYAHRLSLEPQDHIHNERDNQEHYLYADYQNNNHKGNIITHCTEQGYTRILQITQIDYLYSLIKYFMNVHGQQQSFRNQQIEKMAFFILQNLFKKIQFQQPTTKKITQIISLFINLIIIAISTTTVYNQHYNMLVNEIYPQRQGLQMITTFIDQQVAELAIKLLVHYRNNLINMTQWYQMKLNIFDHKNDGVKKQNIKFINLQTLHNLIQSTSTREENSKECDVINSSKFNQLAQNKSKQQQANNMKSQLKQKSERQQQKSFLANGNQPIMEISTFELLSSTQKCHQSQHSLPTVQLMIDYSILTSIKQILQPIWTMQLQAISSPTCQIILDKLDKIIQIISKLKQKNISYSQQKMLKQNKNSSPSTRDNSIYADNQHYHEYQGFVFKVQQLVTVIHLTRYLYPYKLTLREAYFSHPCIFSQNLFVMFVRDFDQQLLSQLSKVIPKYIQAVDQQQFPKELNMIIQRYPLKYWLQVYESICGISNRSKIIRIMKNGANNVKYIRKKQIVEIINKKKIGVNKNQQNKIQLLEIGIQKKAIIPQFILEYLINQKCVHYQDLQYEFKQNQWEEADFGNHVNRNGFGKDKNAVGNQKIFECGYNKKYPKYQLSRESIKTKQKWNYGIPIKLKVKKSKNSEQKIENEIKQIKKRKCRKGIDLSQIIKIHSHAS